MDPKLDNKHLRKELEKIGVEAIGYLTQLLTEKNKYASGNLIASLDYDIIKEMDSLMLKILASPYFKNVDEGRRPGAKPPPTKAIQSWIKQKGIVFKGLSDSQTAFVIARSIGMKGIKPLNAKQKLIDNLINKKTELLKKAATEDIQDLLNKIFYTTKK